MILGMQERRFDKCQMMDEKVLIFVLTQVGVMILSKVESGDLAVSNVE